MILVQFLRRLIEDKFDMLNNNSQSLIYTFKDGEISLSIKFSMTY